MPHITIGNEKVTPTTEAKNIGYIFDHLMDAKTQISQICKSGWFHLRNIGKIRPYLDTKATETLVHAYITSKLDINNCLLLGLPDSLLRKLQILQNASARLVRRLPKRSHITPTLKDLHWLPVQQRIKFKTLLIVFKALDNLAPEYIQDLLVRKINSVRSLRSNNQNLLVVPRSRTTKYADRNFKCAAPVLWNSLPAEIRDCDKVETFKRLLKTYLFEETFGY